MSLMGVNELNAKHGSVLPYTVENIMFDHRFDGNLSISFGRTMFKMPVGPPASKRS